MRYLGLLLLAAAAAAEVTIAPTAGGFTVVTPVYRAMIDARGVMQSLQVGPTEFLKPATEYTWQKAPVVWPGVALGMSRGGGWAPRLYLPTGAEQVAPDRVRADGDGWSLTYIFGADTVAFRFQGIVPSDDPNYVSLYLSLSDQVARACDPAKAGEIPWPEVEGGYKGDIALLDAAGRGFVAEKGGVGKRIRPEWPRFVSFFGLQGHQPTTADVTHRIRVFTEPSLEHSLRLEIASPNPDHFFPGSLAATFPVTVSALYGKACTGDLRFVGAPYVWKEPEVRVTAPLALTAAQPAQTVDMVVAVPTPGHWTGDFQVVVDDTVVATRAMGLVVSPEKIAPAPIPADFDAFWDDTLAELEKIPLDMELTEFPDMENAAGRRYKVKYRSWGGRWAYAWLSVPKTEEKVPGLVVCPAVGVYQPGMARPAEGGLIIRAAVHGGDIEERYPKPDFDYMNTGITDRETFMLRYSYCCLARCYDIVRSQPLCNGTVNAQGGSQGGGLSLVLAGLWPVANVQAASIALCRIDWTILGHTRWGPRLPDGEDPERIAAIVAYYDPARFMHRVQPGTTIRLLFGLFDFCAPAEALFSAVNGLPPTVTCEVYADPYGEHGTGTGEPAKRFYGNAPPIVIPRWQGSAADNKLVR